MKSINLIFGCHSHQPVGNFDFVLERAYDQAYLPFVEVLERFPAVHVTFHYTGPLWDWFLANRPEYIARLKRLVEAGQIEIMGGGYYEPLLCAIPDRDAVAQIRRMQAFCLETFGRAPRGMWLTERVWEPHAASVLARAGVEYTALDDTHFLCSGLRPEDLFGYYMTEDEGRTLKLFPILEKLRYMIPFHSVEETIEYLREQATEDGTRCAVIHDDGEKFGIWPGTNQWVYEKGWLERFFTALTENKDWLHSLTYAEYLDRAKALGRTYITCASYFEMMEWVLPTPLQRELHQARKELQENRDLGARYLPFIRGGFWRGFLAKYEESNNVQKRMLRASNRLETLRAAYPDDARLEVAERLLHQGQCNCAYWHGVFGGLYLNHLRTALYEKLIEADRVMDGVEHPDETWVRCERCDFDGDGNDEAVLDTPELTAFFHPTDGGTLFELDYKPRPFNFGNSLTRRAEPYHDALREGRASVGDEGDEGKSIHELVKAKEKGLDSLLVYDPWRRVSLRDRFLPAATTIEEVWACREHELGDFVRGEYTLATESGRVCLSRRGTVEMPAPQPVRIEKCVVPVAGASALDISYNVQWPGGNGNVLFGVEFVANLLAGDAYDRYYRSENRDLGYARLGTRAREDALEHFAMRDDWMGLDYGLHFSQPARIYRFPLETVSQSEDGQERVYQGSVALACWSMPEAPAEWTCSIRVAITRTGCGS